MRTRTNNIGNGLPSHVTNPAPNTIAICIAMGFIFNFLKIRVSVVQPRRVAPTDARSAPEGRAQRVHSAAGHHFFQLTV